jgi:hypothetical protein
VKPAHPRLLSFGRLVLLSFLFLAVTPYLRAQCGAGGSAAVDSTAGTVTLTASTGGQCGPSSVVWQLDHGNFVFEPCPDNQSSCTINVVLDSCMTDGAHVFHLWGACGQTGPNNSCDNLDPTKHAPEADTTLSSMKHDIER